MQWMAMQVRACWQAVRAFFRAEEKRQGDCPQGHPWLMGWEECPMCRLTRGDRSALASAASPVLALRIRECNGALRTVVLPSGNYLIGQTADCDVVVTPQDIRQGREDARYQLTVGNGGVNIQAEQQDRPLVLAGKEYRDAPIFDRDSFSLLGVDMECIRLTLNG